MPHKIRGNLSLPVNYPLLSKMDRGETLINFPFRLSYSRLNQNMDIKHRYGNLALVAGGSEGLGAAHARYLAASGLDLVLVARRSEVLEPFAVSLRNTYGVQVDCLTLDLGQPDAAQHIIDQLSGRAIDILVYNPGYSYIGKFEAQPLQLHHDIMQINMITALDLVYYFGNQMLVRGKGAIVLMASLAGFQGTGFIATYAATKAFDQILAESLWYEWKSRGVDVIACCAGATATPNFLNTRPRKQHPLAPKVQKPEDVVRECYAHLGKRPSIIAGRANKIATFFMLRLMSRKSAIRTMGDTTTEMYM